MQCHAKWLNTLSAVLLKEIKETRVEEGLRFGTNGNAKLGRGVWHFSILSGSTCPGAKDCKAWVRVTDDGAGGLKRKLEEAPDAKFRCFSASQEIAFTSVFKSRQHNTQLLQKARTKENMTKLLLEGLSEHAGLLRVHIAGDFYNQAYFDAWMAVAKARPRTRMYAYTKSITYWKDYLRRHGKLPANFRLTASLGGKFDHLVDKKRMCYAVVVRHPEEAVALGLPIEDTDDSLAQEATAPFALVIHGVQKAGTEAAAAVKRMRDEGVHFGYKRNK